MEQKKTNLIEAAVEFLSRGTSTNPLNEKSDSRTVETSAYTPQKNSDGKTLNTTLYTKYYQQRAKIHEKEMNHKDASDDHKKNDQGHMERAKAAHEAHTHAISVHNSPTASPKEKHDAAKKAVHASLKYWKHQPLSLHDTHSDRRESDWDSNYASERSHPDWKHV